jgi:hypothetical protein
MDSRPNVIGIGCFAESHTLHRVFKKALESYILIRYEDLGHRWQCALDDENATQFFRSVVTLGIEKPDQIDRALESIPKSATINGFFLGLSRQTLHLVLFFLRSGHRQTKFIVRLEKFNRLRKNRLH